MTDERMTTYRRADGELIDEFGWVTDLGPYEWDEPTEFVVEVWERVSVRTITLPTCSQCERPATHWGLCEPHAREDDPGAFA